MPSSTDAPPAAGGAPQSRYQCRSQCVLESRPDIKGTRYTEAQILDIVAQVAEGLMTAIEVPAYTASRGKRSAVCSAATATLRSHR